MDIIKSIQSLLSLFNSANKNAEKSVVLLSNALGSNTSSVDILWSFKVGKLTRPVFRNDPNTQNETWWNNDINNQFRNETSKRDWSLIRVGEWNERMDSTRISGIESWIWNHSCQRKSWFLSHGLNPDGEHSRGAAEKRIDEIAEILYPFRSTRMHLST